MTEIYDPSQIIDSHIHFENMALAQDLMEMLEQKQIHRAGIVAPARLGRVNPNPQAMVLKALYPDRIFAFGGLEYSSLPEDRAATRKHLGALIRRLHALGCDGVKLLETKPTMARKMPFTIDDEAYSDFFAYMEQEELPIMWHVADPEEFWDESKLSADAVEKGWAYTDPSFPAKEELYTSVDRVLQRFPRLKAVFCHFYFLSNDLKRAGKLLDTYENVCLDLTPGAEMFAGFTRDRDEAIAFFNTYQDRLIFGTDISAGGSGLDRTGAAEKLDFMRNFYETDQTMPMPEGDGAFLQQEGTFHGLALPDSILRKIYYANFERVVSASPRPLNLQLAADECHRIGLLLEEKHGTEREENFGYDAEETIRQMMK